MKRYKQFIEYIFPSYCLNCETVGPYLCYQCAKQLLAHPEICIGCHKPTRQGRCCLNCRQDWPFVGTIIGFQYNKLIQKIISQSKYQKRYDIINFLAEKMVLILLAHPALYQSIQSKELIISYVPMHWYKERFIRGFNQSKLLAQTIAKDLEVPCVQLAYRTQHTKPQMKKSRQKRLQLSKHLFVGSQKKGEIGKTILLIDDITTTGTTLKLVAQAIKSQYPHSTIRGGLVARHH